MFKGKVIIYKTDPKTGKVYQVEKEFTDPREYEEFVRTNTDLLGGFEDFGKSFSFGDFVNLERLIDQLIGRRLGYYEKPYYSTRGYEFEELPVDISKYEYEAQRIEEEKRKLVEKKKKLQEALRKLEEYRDKFKEAGKEDLLKNVEEDIKKVKEELKKLEGSNKKKK